MLFLEKLGEVFAKKLVRKHGELMRKIIDTGFKIACEDTADYPEDEDNPHELSLSLLFVFASEIPSEVSYPIFK